MRPKMRTQERLSAFKATISQAKHGRFYIIGRVGRLTGRFRLSLLGHRCRPIVGGKLLVGAGVFFCHLTYPKKKYVRNRS